MSEFSRDDVHQRFVDLGIAAEETIPYSSGEEPFPDDKKYYYGE